MNIVASGKSNLYIIKQHTKLYFNFAIMLLIVSKFVITPVIYLKQHGDCNFTNVHQMLKYFNNLDTLNVV